MNCRSAGPLSQPPKKQQRADDPGRPMQRKESCRSAAFSSNYLLCKGRRYFGKQLHLNMQLKYDGPLLICLAAVYECVRVKSTSYDGSHSSMALAFFRR